ncbi:MAG: hypothetical protein N3E44_03795 [Candidatus Bathyarchaeota archaeon]|nr:hypothetical protein [Candidatus Bathyarchaeota archaeon]
MTLLEAILSILDDGIYKNTLPYGVSEIEAIGHSIVRVTFKDRIEQELLSLIALSEGYTIDYGSYELRILDRGVIVIRVGSRSDKGGGRSIFVYLIPASVDAMNLYEKCVASMQGILDEEYGEMDLDRLIDYNLRILRIVDEYWKCRYGWSKPRSL